MLTPTSSLVRSPRVTFAPSLLDSTLSISAHSIPFSAPTHSPNNQLSISPLACSATSSQPSTGANSCSVATTHQPQYFVFPEVPSSVVKLTTNDHSNKGILDASKLSASSESSTLPTFQLHNVLDIHSLQGEIYTEEASDNDLNFPCTLEEMYETLKQQDPSQQSNRSRDSTMTTVLQVKQGLRLGTSSETNQDNVKHNKNQPSIDKSSPQQRQPLALSLHKAENTADQSAQEVTKPHEGNTSNGQETHLNIRLKPIPVSSPTNSPAATVPQQINFQDDNGERYQPTNKASPCLIYVVRSPTTSSKITNEVTDEPDKNPHTHYQQTDF